MEYFNSDRKQIPYELRQRSQFHLPLVHSPFSGTESLKFLWLKIWTLVPNEIKESEGLEKFENEIKQ